MFDVSKVFNGRFNREPVRKRDINNNIYIYILKVFT